MVTGPFKSSFKKLAVYAISNIAAGTEQQVQAVVDAGLLPPVVELLSSPATPAEIYKEAAWVITNAVDNGSDNHVRYLAQVNAVKPLCERLRSLDGRILNDVLKSIGKFLEVRIEIVCLWGGGVEK